MHRSATDTMHRCGRTNAVGPDDRCAITDAVLHPITVGALVLWIVNDHYLKHVATSWWTGKLSDVAGMIVFPAFISGLVVAVAPHARSRPERTMLAAALATAVAFAAVKTWHPAADAYRWGLALLQWPFRAVGSLLHQGMLVPLQPVVVAMDVTDLYTIPLAIVPWCLTRFARATPRT